MGRSPVFLCRAKFYSHLCFTLYRGIPYTRRMGVHGKKSDHTVYWSCVACSILGTKLFTDIFIILFTLPKCYKFKFSTISVID